MIEKIMVTTTPMTVRTSLKKGMKGILAILTLILMPLISACNAFAPSETTFIVNYPPPRFADFYISESQLNGEIAITLNPTINNELSEYWLVLGSDSNLSTLPSTLGGLNDIYDLEATPERAVNNFYTNLTNVRSYFSRNTVNNYVFTNLDFPTLPPTSDHFYEIGVRAWGSNDSFAVANRHNGWIISPLSETLIFYLGYETNLGIPPGIDSANGVGYRHTTNTTNQDSGMIDSGPSVSNPDIVFFSNDSNDPDTAIGIAVARSDVRLIPRTPGERLGNIIDISALEATDGITSDATEGFIVQNRDLFLIEHPDGTNRHYSKLLIESADSTNVQIQLLYTGTNGVNLEQF